MHWLRRLKRWQKEHRLEGPLDARPPLRRQCTVAAASKWDASWPCFDERHQPQIPLQRAPTRMQVATATSRGASFPLHATFGPPKMLGRSAVKPRRCPALEAASTTSTLELRRWRLLRVWGSVRDSTQPSPAAAPPLTAGRGHSHLEAEALEVATSEGRALPYLRCLHAGRRPPQGGVLPIEVFCRGPRRAHPRS